MCICIYGDKTRFRLGDEFKCVYIYRDIHIHTHTYMYLYIYIHLYMCEFICTYVPIHIYVYIYIHMYTYTYIYIDICIIYTYICTPTCIYTHMYVYLHPKTQPCNSTTLNPILKFYHPKLSTPQSQSRKQLDSTSEFNPHRNRSAGLFRAAVRPHGGGCSWKS